MYMYVVLILYVCMTQYNVMYMVILDVCMSMCVCVFVCLLGQPTTD